MALRKLAKDDGSGKDGCPTIYLDDDGTTAVVQGDLVDAATFAELEHPLPGEHAVRIKASVIEAAAARLLAERQA